MVPNTQSYFEDLLPTMADKLGGEGLIEELCNGLRLLMDGDKGVITFDSLKKNAALLGLQELREDDLRGMLREGDFDGYGPDAPPRKLLLQRNSCELTGQQKELKNQPVQLMCFFLWASMWAFYVLVLCGISVKQYGGLWEPFKRTYGFILPVEDLSPTIGVLWYLEKQPKGIGPHFHVAA
ncbi:Calcium-binding protein PBP1 [Camellia lanceoleosa]|uniref:Calcium-binding protein PBP1 n=1 Tax=Camellia lanceoleosa TaxID=1840588 RepID=A0ACC0H5K3_9ERIC|nr:Calcium-binding protein PBP1 [Camellia lanceoleosa]